MPIPLNPEFDFDTVEAELAGTQFAGRLTHLRTTGSTNTLAIAAAQAGALSGVWVADEQTAGRGRGGHSWHSVAGDGLYVSVLVRPKLHGADVLKISLAAGLAAKRAAEFGMRIREHTPGAKAPFMTRAERPNAKALGYLEVEAGPKPKALGYLEAKAPGPESEALGSLKARAPRVDLRWPNDLMVTGHDGVERKFGGILTESAMDGGDGALAYAVVGIGMNLNPMELPEELREAATSLRMASGARVSRERVLVELLRGLESEVARLEAEVSGASGKSVGNDICERFERASGWVRGLRVKVEEEGGYTGVTDGLDERGLLRVQLDDDSVRVVRHGGVRRA